MQFSLTRMNSDVPTRCPVEINAFRAESCNRCIWTHRSADAVDFIWLPSSRLQRGLVKCCHSEADDPGSIQNRRTTFGAIRLSIIRVFCRRRIFPPANHMWAANIRSRLRQHARSESLWTRNNVRPEAPTPTNSRRKAPRVMCFVCHRASINRQVAWSRVCETTKGSSRRLVYNNKFRKTNSPMASKVFSET